MAISAKVRNKQIDTGKVLHALVQGEHASGNITFQIIGETELVEDFNSTYFYLLYTRPGDTRPNVLLLTNKQLQDDVISVTFKPTSYFTAQDGTVQIQIMATDTEGLSIDSETGTISGSVIWQTFPGAMFVHASQLTGTETIIEENVLTQYLAGMQDLNTQTEQSAAEAQQAAQDAGESAEAAAGSATAAANSESSAQTSAQQAATAKTAAETAKNKAAEWAEKETAVEPGKYSAKHWAEQAHSEFNALDTYVDETLKPALDDYEETKEGELDTYTATKKAELDTYEGTKETELNVYTGTKKSELDTYTGTKKGELDSYVANTSKPALDSYVENTLEPALLEYEQTQEGTLNTYTGTKKSELDFYVENTTKPSIDDYIEDEKKPEIDAYIAQQAGQFGADVTALKGNVSALGKRVSNIEESLDVITEIEYPNATYGTGEVPPNKAKYAEVNVLKRKSRAWNQHADHNANTITLAGVTFTNNGDGSWSLSGTSTAVCSAYVTTSVSWVNGHYYLIAGCPKTNLDVRIYVDGNANSDKGDGVIFQATTEALQLSIRIGSGVNCDGLVFRPILRDLTIIFPDLPSTDLVTSNIPNLVKLCPDLLKYDDYGNSLVRTTVSGVKSIGVNLVNGSEMELGYYNVNTGVPIDSTTRLRTVTPIRVVPNTRYYAFCSNSGQTKLSIFMYDANMNYIDWLQPNNSNFLVSGNCCFIQVCTYDGYGTTFQNDIQICLNDYADKTTYHPYMTDTLTLTTPFTGKSAGTVADTDELNVEVLVDGVKVNKRRQTKRVGSYTFTGNEVITSWGSGYPHLFQVSAVENAKKNNNYNFTTPRYLPYGTLSGDKYAQNCIYTAGTLYFVVNDIDCTTVEQLREKITGMTFDYELADESVTLLEPIPNPFIKVEGGGTIKPVQTNEPEIDSAMTVTYVNKITA